MKSFPYIQLTVLLASLVFSTHLSAQEQPVAVSSLNFSKSWFKPSLTEDHDPSCKEMLDLTQRAFFSDSRSLQAYFKTAMSGVLDSYPPPEIKLGGKTLYLKRYVHPGCGTACEAYQLLASTSKFPDLNQLDFYSPLLASSPPALPDETTLLVHQDSETYRYFSFAQNLDIYQLQTDASWKKLCVVATSPTDKDFATIPAAKKVSAALGELNDSINKITGSPGDCGSLRTADRWKEAIRSNLPIAIYRPWAMYEVANVWGFDSSYENDIADMEAWSKAGLHENNQFLAYRQQLGQTSKLLADFYQTSYGWSKPQAEKMAHQALTTAISSGIRFHEYIPFSKEEQQLREAILQKKPLSAIQSIALDYSTLDSTSGYDSTESILNLAITYPEVLKFLLDKKLSPNKANKFGKTPLMYAAQYNQLESAKILLDSGANPNAFTIIPEDNCNYTLSKSKMTALHYAVRYASPELIELLIEKGANPYAKTSEQSGYPIDWLHSYSAAGAAEPNPHIAAAELARIASKLTLPSAEVIDQKLLQYNLQAEQEYKNGNIDAAYELTLKAISLNPKDDRAQANMGLIAVKAGREGEALEATQNLISNSEDDTQKANAWFNYGLICEKHLPNGFISYNGASYCNNNLLLSFINAYKLKPSLARANKLISLFNGKIPLCSFTKDNTRLILRSRQNEYGKGLYILQTKGKDLDINDFSWMTTKTTRINGSNSEEKVKINPTSLLAEYDLGEYKLSILESKTEPYRPIQFGGEICTAKYEIQPAPNP